MMIKTFIVMKLTATALTKLQKMKSMKLFSHSIRQCFNKNYMFHLRNTQASKVRTKFFWKNNKIP